MKHTKAYITSGLLLIAALFSALPSYADAVITDAEYFIKEMASTKNSGTITATLVDGSWQIEAVPSNPEKWRFDHWNDLSSSDPNYRTNPRTISLDKLATDQSISATFQYFVWTGCYSAEEMLDIVTAYDEAHHYGHINATLVDGVYYAEAVPESSAYTFAQWSDGSYVNPRVFDPTLIGSDALYATFIPTATKGNIDFWRTDGLVITTEDGDDLEDAGSYGAVTVFYDGQLMSSSLPDYFSALSIEPRVDAGVYYIPATYADELAGKNCHIVFKDDGCIPVATLDAVIPVLVDDESNVDVSGLGTKTDVHVLNGGVATLSGTQTVGALDVYPGGKAVIAGDITADEVTMRADAMTYLNENGYGDRVFQMSHPELLVTGTLTNANSNIINYDYVIDLQAYYTFALPYQVNTASVTYRSGDDARDHFVIGQYFGANRAAGGTGWNQYNSYYDYVGGGDYIRTDHVNIIPGAGYNIYAEPLVWDGDYQEGYGAVMRFPMTVNLSSEGEPAKSVAVSQYDSEKKENKNWNMISVPYLTSYNGTISLYKNSDPVLDEESNPVKLRYITVSNPYFKEYDQELVELATLYPFHSYFVQFEGDVNKLVFENPNPAERASAPKRRQAKAQTNEELMAGITLSQNGISDHTGLFIGEKFTNDYDVNADLVKMFGESQSVRVFSLLGSKKLAYIAIPAASGTGLLETTIPLGYSSATVGEEMTFAFDELRYAVDENISELNLIDNVEGVEVNLLEEPYTCTAYEAADNTRFSLGVRYTKRAPQIATDICDIDAEVSTLNDGVYDLLGRRISADSRTLRTGVYIIIENGQARKEVIR